MITWTIEDISNKVIHIHPSIALSEHVLNKVIFAYLCVFMFMLDLLWHHRKRIPNVPVNINMDNLVDYAGEFF